MSFLFFALVVALLGAFNPNLYLLKRDANAYLKGYAWRFLIAFIGVWLIAYAAVPSLAGPFWGLTPWLVCVWVLNAIVSFAPRFASYDYREVPFPKGVFVFGGFSLLFLIVAISGSSLFTATARHSMLGQVKQAQLADASGKQLEPKDLAHIRMVSLEQASWAADKVLGEADKAIGSRFHVGYPSLQRVGNDFVWVAPLEYNGFRHWQSNNGTPGYVTVSAVDAQAQAKLVTQYDSKPMVLKYMPSAWFGDQLERFLWNRGYKSYDRADYDFELDDELRPWWVVSLTQPTHGYSVDKIVKVLLVDPQSGEIQEYEPKDVPTWVDRVIPYHLAEEYVSWWGSYADGWWNSVWTKDAVVSPTRIQMQQGNPSSETMTLVYGADNQAYWFTGCTSASATDDGLVSYVLINSRTGEATEYRQSGPHEGAVMTAVNAAVSNFDGWHATTPVPYHLYGETVWVVPVVSNNNIFQKLAIVRASNSRVALGGDKQTALRDFQRLMTMEGNRFEPSVAAAQKALTFRVERCFGDVQNGTTVYHLWTSAAVEKIFTGTSSTSPELPLVTVGDEVEVGYIETTERVVPMSSFAIKQMSVR